MKNIILIDAPTPSNWEFIEKIKIKTKLKWEIRYKEGRVSTPRFKRIYNYITFPLTTLWKVKLKYVIAWQQFYGLFLVLYNKLCPIQKDLSVVIMTFIYKKRKGIIGYLYYKFIYYILESKSLQKLVVFSKNEINYYSKIFPKVKAKFEYVPLGIGTITGVYQDNDLNKQKYIFTAGSSNRDYKFLISSINQTNYNLKIACTGLDISHGNNIEILHGIHGQAMFQYLYNAYIVVIPLQDLEISSGQLMILQALQLGKPIIVTNNKGVYDYILNKQTGFIIPNTYNKLIQTIDLLYQDSELYNKISNAQKAYFKDHFSIEKLGENIANIIQMI